MAEDSKVYQVQYHGAGTFTISKPKRKVNKRRQLKLKSPGRRMRK